MKYKVGDMVKYNSYESIRSPIKGTIGVIRATMPYGDEYKVEFPQTSIKEWGIWWYGEKELSPYDSTLEKDLLRYGEILTDDMFGERITTDYKTHYTRIRTIAHNNHVYYHKTINGEVVEVKELM